MHITNEYKESNNVLFLTVNDKKTYTIPQNKFLLWYSFVIVQVNVL